jgi:hypothetical protein
VVTIIAPPPKASGPRAVSNKPALTAKEALAAKAKAAQAKVQKAPVRTDEPAPEAATTEAAAFDQADLTASWETAVEAARKAGDRASALVDAWLAASNIDAIAAVVDDDAVSGAARKNARRALNVLKSRGLAIPTKPRVSRIDSRAAVALEATFLPPDSTGTTAISITSRDASGRYHLAEVIVRENVGIVNAGSAWLSGTQLREGRARALEGLGVAPAHVPVEWARARIAAAKKQNAASGRILPLGLAGCQELIELAADAVVVHPLADIEAAVTSEVATARTAGSDSLHEEPEFRSWLPDRGTLEDLLQHLGQRLGPQGTSDPQLVNTALREEMESSTDRFFSPDVRNVIATRMHDAAISVRSRKGNDRATDVLAVARAVREAGLITAPPREIPFLVAFMQKGISLMAHQGGGSLRIPMAAPAPQARQALEAPEAPEAPQADESTESTG